MSKGKDTKKKGKNQPSKTTKEKSLAKKAKKAKKDNPTVLDA